MENILSWHTRALFKFKFVESTNVPVSRRLNSSVSCFSLINDQLFRTQLWKQSGGRVPWEILFSSHRWNFTSLSNSGPHSSGSRSLRAWHKCLSVFDFRKAPCSLWLKSENELAQATWRVFPMLKLSDLIQWLVLHSKLAISPQTNKSARENVNLYQRIQIRRPDSAVSR